MSQSESQSVICPREYKEGLEGCGAKIRYTRTTDNGLIRCPDCGLWFSVAFATELSDVTGLHAA